MPVELLLYLIIALLVFDIAVTARVAMVSQQMREVVAKKPSNGKPTNSDLIETMAERVAAIDREMLPKDGATISFRINSLTNLANQAVTTAITATATARSAIEEQRNSAQRAADERARLERLVANLQTTTEGLLVATARATEAAVKIIQNTVQTTDSKIDQLAAGTDIGQTITKTHPAVPVELVIKVADGVAKAAPTADVAKVAGIEKVADGVTKATEGLGATQEGVAKIQEGIDQLTKDTDK